MTDNDSKVRTVLSYKSYLEVFVVAFFSTPCDIPSSEWARFRRLDERYNDWRVAFLAVNTSAPEKLPEIATSLKHYKIPWPVAQDSAQAAATLFKISGTPEVVILDESGVLRYRGPIEKVPAALDAVIGHTDDIGTPEPPFTPACPLP